MGVDFQIQLPYLVLSKQSTVQMPVGSFLNFKVYLYKLFYLTSIYRLYRQKSSIIFENNTLCANIKFRK